MPGAVPHTSTYALTNETLTYVMALANKGLMEAIRTDPTLEPGVNTAQGEVVNEPVAQAHSMNYRPLREVLA